MIIKRDTTQRRMDVTLNDEQVTGKEVEYDHEGRVQGIMLKVEDGEKFIYRVYITREELWDVLRDMIPAEKEACPF